MCARLVQEVGLLRLEVGFHVTGRVSGGSRRGNAYGHVKPDRETREADFSGAARIPCVACCSEVLDTGRDDYVHVHPVVVRVKCGERPSRKPFNPTLNCHVPCQFALCANLGRLFLCRVTVFYCDVRSGVFVGVWFLIIRCSANPGVCVFFLPSQLFLVLSLRHFSRRGAIQSCVPRFLVMGAVSVLEDFLRIVAPGDVVCVCVCVCLKGRGRTRIAD